MTLSGTNQLKWFLQLSSHYLTTWRSFRAIYEPSKVLSPCCWWFWGILSYLWLIFDNFLTLSDLTMLKTKWQWFLQLSSHYLKTFRYFRAIYEPHKFLSPRFRWFRNIFSYFLAHFGNFVILSDHTVAKTNWIGFSQLSSHYLKTFRSFRAIHESL